MGKNNSPIILLTIHSAKGLEFPQVIACGLWKEGVQHETGSDLVETNRKVAYVGFTRATESLKIITLESNPMISDLRYARGLPDKPRSGNLKI